MFCLWHCIEGQLLWLLAGARAWHPILLGYQKHSRLCQCPTIVGRTLGRSLFFLIVYMALKSSLVQDSRLFQYQTIVACRKCMPRPQEQTAPGPYLLFSE